MPQDKLLIQLEAANTQYLPGDVVRGKLEVIAKRERSIAALKIKLEGTATVQGNRGGTLRYSKEAAMVSENVCQPTYNHTYTILEFATTLLGDGVKDTKLPAGKSSFNFAFHLPHRNLPASGQNEQANTHVEYVLKATLKRPGWYIGRVKTTQEITVYNDRTGNLLGWSNLKQMAFLCSGPFSIYIRLDPEMFLPEKTIVVRVRLTELNGESKIEQGTASIVQETTTVVSGAKLKQSTKEIAIIELVKDPDNCKSWSGNLKVLSPPVARTPGETAPIGIHYGLRLKAKAHGYVFLLYPSQPEDRARMRSSCV